MELEKMREQIEGINGEIITLLAKRKALTLKISELKKKEKMPTYDPVREKKQRMAISIKARANNLNQEAVLSFLIILSPIADKKWRIIRNHYTRS